jgi:hypothetical protein
MFDSAIWRALTITLFVMPFLAGCTNQELNNADQLLAAVSTGLPGAQPQYVSPDIDTQNFSVVSFYASTI